eukprot:4978389-Pyramimonas_sp.AAC.1
MEDCTTKVLALVQQFAGDKAGELTTYLCQTAHNATEALIEATEAHHNLDTLNATVLEQADAITTVGDSLDGYFVLANAYLVFFMQVGQSSLRSLILPISTLSIAPFLILTFDATCAWEKPLYLPSMTQ